MIKLKKLLHDMFTTIDDRLASLGWTEIQNDSHHLFYEKSDVINNRYVKCHCDMMLKNSGEVIIQFYSDPTLKDESGSYYSSCYGVTEEELHLFNKKCKQHRFVG